MADGGAELFLFRCVRVKSIFMNFSKKKQIIIWYNE